MYNLFLRAMTLGLLGNVKKKNIKFEDTEAFKLWQMIGAFGGFLTLQPNQSHKNKIIAVTHPNLIAILYNALFSFTLSLTVLGLILTLPALKTFKKYEANIPYVVYLGTMIFAAFVWAFMIVSSILGPDPIPDPALRQLPY